MISVSEALQLIEKHAQFNAIKVKPIIKTMGLVLAEDVISAIHMPPFKQSSMDGYAFAHSDSDCYTVVDEIQAGSARNVSLKRGEAVRIFTGARVPDSADTVIMQEHVQRQGNQLNIKILPKIYQSYPSDAIDYFLFLLVSLRNFVEEISTITLMNS